MQIIKERLPEQKGRDGTIWNRSPGALVTLPEFSDTSMDFPFHTNSCTDHFTAVIYCQLGLPVTPTSTLSRLIINVAKSKFVSRVSITFSNDFEVLPFYRIHFVHLQRGFGA